MADRWGAETDGAAFQTITAAAVPERADERRNSHRRGRWHLSQSLTGTTPPPLIVRGVLAGVAATLSFRYVALLLLSVPGLVPAPSFALKPSPGMVIPALAGAVLWGAMFGAVLALVLSRCRAGRTYWLVALALGALVPTALSFGPLLLTRGADMSAWIDVLAGMVVNGAWGVGTALFLLML
jgi:hypothetical protein